MRTPAKNAARDAGLDPTRIPKHIAIIMDGNGRWARQRGLPRLAGHVQGYATVRAMVESAIDLRVQALTLYTFSSENWSRPKNEVDGIMRLIAHAARNELDELHENGVRVIVSGRFDDLPEDVRAELRHEMNVTKDNNRLILNLAINYGGRTEIVDAVRAIAAKAANGELKPEEVDDELISAHLYSPHLPDPDLLIRTAGELRISNFLLWQIAYTEIWVTDVLWPDFSENDLIMAISDYQKRVRKFGKTADQVV
ncbi:MAG: isoprenyl transferase [Armatimonadota bacterium]|nr:isoprenyl transferase [Armatimonadota bacterium]